MITARTAAYILIVINSVVIGFHILVMSGVIPYTAAWGGRLKTWDEMIVFESVSLFINLLIMALLLMKIGLMRGMIPERFITIIFWVLIGVFSLNTIGNLFAESIWEKTFGTSLTLIIAFLLWIIVRNPVAARK